MEITDIKIPFWRLVVILVKWTIAAIPAAIIVIALSWVVTLVIIGLLGVTIPGGPSRL
jgi:hypothetical protein